MKKVVITLASIITLFLPASVSSNSVSKGNRNTDCSFKGIPLYGKVQIVTAFPDIKVQVVTAFPDLKVQKVSAFPDHCGQWQFVDAFPDFKIQFVEAFPDLKIQFVEAFPGLS